MKFGMRTPSLKKSFKARTTGRFKRSMKKALIPGYGKKGMGYIKNPKKAIYNKVYNKTTFGVNDILNYSTKNNKSNNKYKNSTITTNNIKSSNNNSWNYTAQNFNSNPYEDIKSKNKKRSIALIVIAFVFIFSAFSFIGDKDFGMAIFSFTVGIASIALFIVFRNKTNLEIQKLKEEEVKRNIEYQENLKQQEEIKQKQKEQEILYKNQLKENLTNMFNNMKKVEPAINNNSDKKRNLVSNMNPLKFTNITKRTNKQSICDFVVLDIETTGIKISGNRIIEISALRFIDFEPSEYFSTFINPKMSIPEDATNINHITDEMVQNSPEFYQIKDSLLEFIGKSTIIGHNLTFDLRHIYASGLDLTACKKYDTYEIAKAKIKKENPYSDNYEEDTILDYKLSTLCDYFNIDTVNLHSSLYDCYYTGLVFKELVDMVIDD